MRLIVILLLTIVATTVSAKDKAVPVYPGRVPLAYKPYVPKSVRNQRAVERAGIPKATPMSLEMKEYLEKKGEKNETK